MATLPVRSSNTSVGVVEAPTLGMLAPARRARAQVEADVVAPLPQPPLHFVKEARLSDAVLAAEDVRFGAHHGVGRNVELLVEVGDLARGAELGLAARRRLGRLSRPELRDHAFHVRPLPDKKRREDADDQDHDQKLDQGKTTLIAGPLA